MTRHYLEHMVRLGIPLNREWTGDVRAYCEFDGVVYPHFILACVDKYKRAKLIEYEVQRLYDKLNQIESPTLFDSEIADYQDELQTALGELERSDLKANKEFFSQDKCKAICARAQAGEPLTDGDYNTLRTHPWHFRWTFRGTPEQYERACEVKFTCSSLGSEE